MQQEIRRGDCLEAMRDLPSGSVGAIVTDPPYEIRFVGSAWDGSGVAFRVETWSEALRVAAPGSYMLAFGGTRTFHRLAVAIEDAGWQIRDCIMWVYGTGYPKGAGCLKPAYEPILLARKPAAKVSPLNVEGCRVGVAVETWPASRGYSRHDPGSPVKRSEATGESPRGRWPANLIHDGSEEVLEGFPESKATRHVRGEMRGSAGGNVYAGGKGLTGANGVRGHEDSGSAARFFYCAKASKAERSAGLAAGPDASPVRNPHPTVKPVALMRYLCRLVTPPGGLVFDPFCGSGTTGVACKIEGLDFLGVDADPSYCDVARSRIAAASPEQPGGAGDADPPSS